MQKPRVVTTPRTDAAAFRSGGYDQDGDREEYVEAYVARELEEANTLMAGIVAAARYHLTKFWADEGQIHEGPVQALADALAALDAHTEENK